jgi:hypothetical protein
VTLASSRFTSNGPDEVDLATFMSAFQGINKLRLTVELSVVDRGPLVEMQVQVTAWRLADESGEVVPSVLRSVRAGVAHRQTLAAAILQQLYVLDSRLAEDEFAETSKSP